MLGMNKRLLELEKSGKPILVGVIGGGQMGTALISQLTHMKGMRGAVIADHKIKSSVGAYRLAGLKEGQFEIANSIDEVNSLIAQGKMVACVDDELVTKSCVDVVIDATGNPESGAKAALDAINNGKHIVMLNVETDVCIGPILKAKADKAGVIYTGSAGDEPGAVMELYEFATAIGLEVLVMGKGKNNKVDKEANPSSVEEEALRRGMSPKMLASFKDGTKTMVELSAMCNATGFLPGQRGAYGIKASIEDLKDVMPNQIYSKKEKGGILENYKVVDYVDGIAPGVFVVVTSDLPVVHGEIQYLNVGKGPNYVLYRPYHLCSLETPLTVARAVLDRQPTIVPAEGLIAETITVAKRDLKAGEYLDGIGGFCVYGTIDSHENAKKENALPIGLVNKNIKMKKPAKKGELITYDMVELWEDSLVLKLRREQDKMFDLDKEEAYV